MTNDITSPPGGGLYDDDGFTPSSSGSGRGHDFLRWNTDDQWTDRDGAPAPSPLLVVKIDEILRMWKDDRLTDITERPLPDPAELNGKIPASEWEIGLDGKPRPPWAHYVVIYLVNPATATKYVYAASTTGAHIAFEQLKESVITMRMLRGARVMPLVELSSKPMKTKFKMSERPHFEIVGWHLPGGEGVLSAQPTPQLPPAQSAEKTPEKPIEKEDPISSGLATDPNQLSQSTTKPQPQQRKGKPSINATLDAMGNVKPATMAEIIDDQIPW